MAAKREWRETEAEELDALVDRMLQEHVTSTHAQHAALRPSSHALLSLSKTGGLSNSEKNELGSYKGHGAGSVADSVSARQGDASKRGGSSQRNVVTALHSRSSMPRQTRQNEDDEEALMDLVERILAGTSVGDAATAEREGPKRSPPQRSASGELMASSTSPPQRSIPPARHPLPPFRSLLPTTTTGISPHRSSSSWHQPPQRESGSHIARRFHGATRLATGDRSLAHPAHNGAAADSPANVLARRLAHWHERKEAKRVQAVYEALEQEQQECTFTPAINQVDFVAVDEEGQEDNLRESSDRVGGPPHSTAAALRHGGEESVATPSPHVWTYIPSLQPPPNTIYGVEPFVDRLRRAQEEKDAAREAEEAWRLHYYDPTTFRRDFTVPVPFELSASRSRHSARAAASSTDRSFSPGPGSDGKARSAPWTYAYADGYTPSRWVTAAPIATSHPLGGTRPRTASRGYDLEPTRAEEEQAEPEGRLIAEDTFRSLAPYIRHTLLFDHQMDVQLRRATESVRRSGAD